MTTAVEYRQYARECMECARESTNDPVRKQFLDLAKLWMSAAERLEAHPGPSSQPDKLDGKTPPGSARAE